MKRRVRHCDLDLPASFPALGRATTWNGTRRTRFLQRSSPRGSVSSMTFNVFNAEARCQVHAGPPGPPGPLTGQPNSKSTRTEQVTNAIPGFAWPAFGHEYTRDGGYHTSLTLESPCRAPPSVEAQESVTSSDFWILRACHVQMSESISLIIVAKNIRPQERVETHT